MKIIITVVLLFGMGFIAHSQFTVIPTSTSSEITDMSFNGDTIIISGKNNYFAKTFDEGQNIINLQPPAPLGYYNYDFQVIGNKYYIMAGKSLPYHWLIMKSSNYGISWDTLYDTTSLFTTLTMIDTSFGVMAGGYGSYVMTQNSDTAWMLDTLFGQWYLLSTTSASYGDSTLLILTFDGASIITENRGQTWNWGYGPSYQNQEIQFINKDTIYSVAHKGTTNPTSYFSYSYNGGYNWTTINLGLNDSTHIYDFYSRIYDLYFDTPQHGYIIGYIYKSNSININQATIFETNDYGQTWIAYLTGFSEEVFDFLNINDSIAFIGGANGLLLKWNKKVLLTPFSISEIPINNSSFTVFPNPASEYTNINVFNFQSNFQVVVSNTLGQIVYDYQFKTKSSIELSTTGLVDGIYFITLKTGNFLKTEKLIIQHKK